MLTLVISIARNVLVLIVTLTCSGLALSVWATDDQGMAHHDHQSGIDHSQHKQMLQQKGYVRTLQEYPIPDVMLTDQNGGKVSLRAMLGGREPVILNFIFTTCTTICPVLSASFTQTRKILGPDTKNVRMISISIDPEHDTPERLRDYAQRFQARTDWTFLTGNRDDIVSVLKAFDAYRRDKMNHIPLTFMRAAPQVSWIRMEGFASAGDLVRELQALTTQPGSREDLSLL